MAKRILLGAFFTAASFILVQTVMAEMYGLLGQPFKGMLTAGIGYGLIHGTLSVALCQALLVLTADRTLAATATRYAVGIYILLIAVPLVVGLALGKRPENGPSIWPTVSTILPWLLAAIIGRHRLIIDWTRRRPADPGAPPGD